MSTLLRQLKLRVPLIVAPMAGGTSTPEFVAASCEAGALGSMGAAYSTPAQMVEFVHQVRARTARSFAINLFVPTGEVKVTSERLARAEAATQKHRDEWGLPRPSLQPPFEEDFDAQFEAMISLRPDVFSFVFGIPDIHYLREAQRWGITVIGTATTPEEAERLTEAGVDAITLQGIEAGGHRGIFSATEPDAEIPALDLLCETRSRVKLPLIAAGGLMTAADVQAALSLGADAVQMGTLFLATREAGTSAPHRRALLASGQRRTKTTRAFSGRLARGIENPFMLEMDAQPDAILPFPAQNKFTRDLRTASAKADSADHLSLWCGTGTGALPTGTVAEVIDGLLP
ncbi:MAG: nitronate monooxygenase [Bdellovibrionaceae bacterium]|nr:nitronate monooxygenase [Pseudobdellovibrionaceae bacterium]